MSRILVGAADCGRGIGRTDAACKPTHMELTPEAVVCAIPMAMVSSAQYGVCLDLRGDRFRAENDSMDSDCYCSPGKRTLCRSVALAIAIAPAGARVHRAAGRLLGCRRICPNRVRSGLAATQEPGSGVSAQRNHDAPERPSVRSR